jgi:hypothetical protein
MCVICHHSLCFSWRREGVFNTGTVHLSSCCGPFTLALMCLDSDLISTDASLCSNRAHVQTHLTERAQREGPDREGPESDAEMR